MMGTPGVGTESTHPLCSTSHLGTSKPPSLRLGDPQPGAHLSLGSPQPGLSPRAGNLSGPLRLCRIKGCGMTLPPPEISRGADSGKVDV